MKIILNKNNEAIGFSSIENKNAVEAKLKPVSDNESAVWNGKEFEYNFADIIEEMPNKDKDKSTSQRTVQNIQSFVLGSIKPVTGTIGWQFTEGEKVAILIPCYGKSEYICAAVSSCIEQSKMANEIHVLLMDEESIAKKSQLEKMSDIVVCHESTKKNASHARNCLATLTQAEWIIFLDADDLLSENFIEEVSKQKCAVCYPQISILRNNMAEDCLVRSDLSENHCAQAFFQNLTSLMRREVFLEMQLDPEFSQGGEDLDFLLRLLEQKKYIVTHTSKTRYYWRQEVEGQLTRSNAFYESSLNMLYKHKDFLIHELEWIKNATAAQFMSLCFLKNWNEKNLRTYSLFLCSSCGSAYKTALNEICPYIINELRELAQSSRLKETENIFNKNDYIAIGNTQIEEVIAKIENRSFDAIIFNPLDEENPFDMFLRQEDMIIKKDILKEMEKLKIKNGIDRIFYLLRNYSCFMFPNTKNKESIFAIDQKGEELLTELCNMNFICDETKSIINKYTETMKEDIYYTTNLKPLQKATFILNRKCNCTCKYCSEKEMENSCDLSDDEIFTRFDTSLSMLENLTGKRLVPHIMGGEPTIWSESLTEKIIERLRSYREVYLFTNGANRNSKFFGQPNFNFLTHLVNWKGKKYSDFEILANECVNICVLKNELDDVEKFIGTIPTDECKVYFQPCQSQNKEWNMDETGYERLAEILQAHKIPSAVIQYAEDLKNYGAEFVQKNCALGQGVWNVDCISLKISPCCNMKNAVPLEEFNPSRKKDCTGCLNFGNTCC